MARLDFLLRLDDGVGDEGKARFVPDVDVCGDDPERVLGPTRFARSTLEASLFSGRTCVVVLELEL